MTSKVMEWPARMGQTAIMDTPDFGTLLRTWRHRRRRSQLDLATEVPISQRHLSVLESGRARPGRQTVLALARALEVPPRAVNAMLLAAGLAPEHLASDLAAPSLAPVRNAVAAILKGHEPNPALSLDAGWTILGTNRAVAPLIEGVAPRLLAPPANALRLSFDPEGLAPRIVNLREWRAHILARLDAEADRSGSRALAALAAELTAMPLPPGTLPARPPGPEALRGLAVPLVIDTRHGRMALLSTTTVFGTPTDLTVAGLMIESFFPADDETASLLRALSNGWG